MSDCNCNVSKVVALNTSFGARTDGPFDSVSCSVSASNGFDGSLRSSNSVSTAKAFGDDTITF